VIDARLSRAVPDGAFDMAAGQKIVVFNADTEARFDALGAFDLHMIVDSRLAFDHWQKQGFDTATGAGQSYAAALVCLPRAKAQARAMIAQAMRVTGGRVLVDGQKQDGVESVLRDMRKLLPVLGQVNKAHGKLFWCDANQDALADWAAGPALTEGGFWTAPGVFSADAVDPASALLVQALPERLGARVADFGAGWGYLSAHALTDQSIQTIDLVEAGYMALECAKRNVTDPRAQFHWADATQWKPEKPLDCVIMNPPFHSGRAAEPALGQAFISAAARSLARSGTLWMVANRHLPYEEALAARFKEVRSIGDDPRFKLFCAMRPKP